MKVRTKINVANIKVSCSKEDYNWYKMYHMLLSDDDSSNKDLATSESPD